MLYIYAYILYYNLYSNCIYMIQIYLDVGMDPSIAAWAAARLAPIQVRPGYCYHYTTTTTINMTTTITLASTTTALTTSTLLLLSLQ